MFDRNTYCEWKEMPYITVYHTKKILTLEEEDRGYYRCNNCNIVYNVEECFADFDIEYCPSCGYDPSDKSRKIPCNCQVIEDEGY